MNLRRVPGSASANSMEEISHAATEREILDEVSFQERIARERRRTERSSRPFLLMLLDRGNRNSKDPSGQVLKDMVEALSVSIRATDVIGWYWENSVIGVVFTEVAAEEGRSSLSTMIPRVSEILRDTLDMQLFSQIGISFHVYPQCANQGSQESMGNAMLYPDLLRPEQRHRHLQLVKRGIDILGSSAALLVLTPVFILTALMVKLSSKGPVIYRQWRLGQFGQPFELLKFRSMRVDSDPNVHREFMKNVIAGKHDGKCPDSKEPVYKMTNDRRITPIGRIMRKSSMDELPQFFNVLKGEMSLVGPRPPLLYEYQEYRLWHRRRVLEARPGITGLWQVQGRSRVSFDDMVRLDLRYLRTWSLWLDLWIMLKTPRAVLGDDAF